MIREDLFLCINIIPIHLPALRERGEELLCWSKFHPKAVAGKRQQVQSSPHSRGQSRNHLEPDEKIRDRYKKNASGMRFFLPHENGA